MADKFVGTWNEVEKTNHAAFVDKRFAFIDEKVRQEIKQKFSEKMQLRFSAADAGQYSVQLMCGGETINDMTVKPGEERDIASPMGVQIKVKVAYIDGVLNIQQIDPSGDVSTLNLSIVDGNKLKITNTFADVSAQAILQKA